MGGVSAGSAWGGARCSGPDTDPARNTTATVRNAAQARPVPNATNSRLEPLPAFGVGSPDSVDDFKSSSSPTRHTLHRRALEQSRHPALADALDHPGEPCANTTGPP